MKRLIVFTLLTMLTMSCKEINPFLAEWDTPYGIPDFGIIKEKHYIPAVKIGIRQQQSEIDAIIADSEKPTFENTVAAFDRSGEILDRVTGVLFNLSESDATPSLQKIVAKVIPMLSEHNDNIFMNPYLFERVEELYENRKDLKLTSEQMMALEKMYRNFVNNGISLDDAAQARMREINASLSSLELKFGNNLLAETNAFRLLLTDSSEIAGLPEPVLASAASDAEAAGEKGWMFTLHNPSYVPFMTYSSRRDLREKMFRAYSSRGNNDDRNDNKQIVLDIMKLRIEKASMLGYDNPADFILSDKMAHDHETVDRFLEELFVPAVARAKEELARLQEKMNEDVAAGLLPDDSTSVIRPWDWAYYTEKVRKAEYDLDEAEIKPYFKMENVRAGVFATAGRLYGLKFEKLDSIPVYHPDVEGFKITDSDGSLVGILLTDYYPRSSKRGGAWMNNIRNQYVNSKGEDIRPVIVNVGNFTKPSGSSPSLLTLDEVATMFHEFGHALHGLLSECTYKSVSGTSVARDFVELPSQINENWAFQPEVLATYARHYETGEVIPDGLIEKIGKVSKFNQGFMTTELVAASILDMKWHELQSVDGIDPVAFEKKVCEEMGLIDEIIPRYRTTYFNHIFNSGYSAGYYSYLWAEVLDKDAFELFRKKGIFDKVVSYSFRKNILEKGGSEEPMVLYRRFRGADPDPSALLRARGLVNE